MNFFNRIRAGSRGLAMALALGLSIPASAAQAQEYVGGGYVTDMTGCTAAGWPTGVEMFTARYIPGASRSQVVLDLAAGGIMVYNLRGDLAQSRRWRRGAGYAIWGTLYVSDPRPSVRVIERRAATTGNASLPQTSQIRMSLRIRNFNGNAGCAVTAHMMLRNAAATGMAY